MHSFLNVHSFPDQDIMGHEAGLESVNVFPGVMISQFENPSI